MLTMFYSLIIVCLPEVATPPAAFVYTDIKSKAMCTELTRMICLVHRKKSVFSVMINDAISISVGKSPLEQDRFLDNVHYEKIS